MSLEFKSLRLSEGVWYHEESDLQHVALNLFAYLSLEKLNVLRIHSQLLSLIHKIVGEMSLIHKIGEIHI